MAYTNSPLVNYTKLSPNHSGLRTHAIDTITIHCVVGQCSVETLGNIFAPTSRQASSNYGVGVDGRIGMYVEEKNRSWCTSSNANDQRAITIEVASDTTEPYAVKDVAFNALIKLVADICKRNGIKQLKWSTNKEERMNHLNGCNMTVHRDYANKSCPGTYLYNKHGEIAAKVNAILNADSKKEEPEAKSWKGATNEESCYNYLTKVMGLKSAAACGILANFYHESNYRPNNLQNVYEKSLGFTDESYTEAVDKGSYGNFVHDSAGYGLVQWTFYTRKEALLQYAKEKGKSIGDLEMQLEFFAKEVKGYKSVWNPIQECSNDADGAYHVAYAMCYYYEAPATKETQSVTRGNYAKTLFGKYNSEVVTTGLYKVQVGAFKVKANATNFEAKLKASGFDTFVTQIGEYWKVQCGAFKVKANAEALLKKLQEAGYGGAFITYITKTVVEDESSASTIKVGDKVKVLKAETYTGGTFKTYYSKYDVIQVNGDRIVIGIGSVVTAAVHRKNLQKA